MRKISIEHAENLVKRCTNSDPIFIGEIYGESYLIQSNRPPCLDSPIAKIAKEGEPTVILHEYS